MTEKKMDALKQESKAGVAAEARTRKAYEAPELSFLGSVREVTLGATGPKNDFIGGRKKQ